MKRVLVTFSFAAALVAAPALAPSAFAQQAQPGQPAQAQPGQPGAPPRMRPPPHVQNGVRPPPHGFHGDMPQDQAPPGDDPHMDLRGHGAMPPHGAGFGPVPHGDPHAHGQGAGLGDQGAAHEEGGHGEGGGHEEEHGPPKPINWFDFDNKSQPPYGAMLINFILLLGMYIYFGKKPVADALKNRRVEIAKEVEEAQKMRLEAEARAEKYQEKLRHLEDELKDTRAALVEAGKADKDRIVREAEEKAARMEKDAAFLIEQEMKQLRQDLTREAVEMAVTAAEELLKKRVTPVDHERLAEDYLAELASKSKSTPSVAPRAAAPAAQGGTT